MTGIVRLDVHVSVLVVIECSCILTSVRCHHCVTRTCAFCGHSLPPCISLSNLHNLAGTGTSKIH
jgi:hypothetical protein